MVQSTIEIDPEASIEVMLANWSNGNKNEVIEALQNDHAGLTAFFIVEGVLSNRLTHSDCNVVSNRLIDDRMRLAQSIGRANRP